MVGTRLVSRYLSRRVLLRAWRGAEAEDWLSPSEREVFAELRDPSRREGWLCGRLLAKRLILDDVLAPSVGEEAIHPTEIDIHSRDGLGRATRPRVTLRGRLQPWALSIAHSDRSVLVALSRAPGVSVGVDVARLTPRERRWVHSAGEMRLASTLWAVKEAIYKAVSYGEQFTPLRIEVCPRAGGGYTYHWDGAEPEAAHTIHIADSDRETAAIVIAGSSDSQATQ
ncbi:MAG: 4'-phosphopantetheinyl transferase superfamily protein [Chloroflexi bacterium]|nr:4'-phosphopantetheinyl transferase superfamily protein [Chloroflexota bacterium]